MDAGIFGTPRPPTPQLAGGPVAVVRGYWESLRPGGDIPLRTAIDPRGLTGALDRVFLAERIGAGLAQVRLSGTRVNELSGMDMRGLPLSCLFQPDARTELSRVVDGVFQGPRAAELHLTARKELGRPLLAARLLLLPLLDRAGNCTLLLGCIDTGGEIGRAPRRFEILRSVEERLRGAAAPTPEPPAPNMRAAQGFLKLVYSAD